MITGDFFFQETDSEDECEHQTSTVTVIEKIALNPNNNTIQEQEESEKKKTKKKGCWSKIAEVMDLDLLLNFRFLNLAFGISVTYVAEMNFKLVIPFFMANLGYSRSETAQMLSLMAIADVVACVVMPPINDRLSFSRKYTLMLGLTLLSTARSGKSVSQCKDLRYKMCSTFGCCEFFVLILWLGINVKVIYHLL